MRPAPKRNRKLLSRPLKKARTGLGRSKPGLPANFALSPWMERTEEANPPAPADPERAPGVSRPPTSVKPLVEHERRLEEEHRSGQTVDVVGQASWPVVRGSAGLFQQPVGPCFQVRQAISEAPLSAKVGVRDVGGDLASDSANPYAHPLLDPLEPQGSCGLNELLIEYVCFPAGTNLEGVGNCQPPLARGWGIFSCRNGQPALTATGFGGRLDSRKEPRQDSQGRVDCPARYGSSNPADRPFDPHFCRANGGERIWGFSKGTRA